MKAGDRFRQTRSGRIVVILDPEYEDGMAAWHYEDTGKSDWHYCCVDSFIWGGEYERLTAN